MSAENATVSGVEPGPSAVGGGLAGHECFQQSERTSGVCAACGSSPLSPRTVNPDDLQSSENSDFGVPQCTEVYHGVPRSTIVPRPSFLHFPACAKKPVSKRLKKYHGTVVGAALGLQVWQVGWKSPEGWHLYRMAFPKHIELHRSGIFEPE